MIIPPNVKVRVILCFHKKCHMGHKITSIIFTHVHVHVYMYM